MRKPIQIAPMHDKVGDVMMSSITVLCDDGTIWGCTRDFKNGGSDTPAFKWIRLPHVPQD